MLKLTYFYFIYKHMLFKVHSSCRFNGELWYLELFCATFVSLFIADCLDFDFFSQFAPLHFVSKNFFGQMNFALIY